MYRRVYYELDLDGVERGVHGNRDSVLDLNTSTLAALDNRCRSARAIANVIVAQSVKSGSPARQVDASYSRLTQHLLFYSQLHIERVSLVHHYFLQFIHLLDSSGEHILDVASEIDAESGLYSSPSAYSFSRCHDYGLTFLPYQKLLKFLVVLRFPMTSRDGLDSVICTSNSHIVVACGRRWLVVSSAWRRRGRCAGGGEVSARLASARYVGS